jgi:hypothetical protein
MPLTPNTHTRTARHTTTTQAATYMHTQRHRPQPQAIGNRPRWGASSGNTRQQHCCRTEQCTGRQAEICAAHACRCPHSSERRSCCLSCWLNCCLIGTLLKQTPAAPCPGRHLLVRLHAAPSRPLRLLRPRTSRKQSRGAPWCRGHASPAWEQQQQQQGHAGADQQTHNTVISSLSHARVLCTCLDPKCQHPEGHD